MLVLLSYLLFVKFSPLVLVITVWSLDWHFSFIGFHVMLTVVSI